jgi:hypothetical protein
MYERRIELLSCECDPFEVLPGITLRDAEQEADHCGAIVGRSQQVQRNQREPCPSAPPSKARDRVRRHVCREGIARRDIRVHRRAAGGAVCLRAAVPGG